MGGVGGWEVGEREGAEGKWGRRWMGGVGGWEVGERGVGGWGGAEGEWGR